MPFRLVAVPTIVGIIFIVIGIVIVNGDKPTFGWVLIISWAVIIVANYFVRRGVWVNSPTFRNRMLRK
jgi:hypothetical protein